jgi:hypothetical protein
MVHADASAEGEIMQEQPAQAQTSKDHSMLAFRYMQVLAVELATVLHNQGVTDVAVQREIVESFLFGMAVGWDQYYITDFKTGRSRVRPAICFRDGNQELIVPHPDEEFHEGAPFAATRSVFEPNEPDSDLEFVYDNGINGDVPYSKQLRSPE